MSPTYLKNKRLRLHERAMRGVVARERMRMERTEAMRDVGGLVTDGCLGAHSVRLLAWPDGKHVAVTVDGRHRQARTLRGVARIMAQIVCRKLGK
jgi:hypothetical protein